VFFTFVFAYIQTRGVKRLEKYIRNRTVRVLIMGVVILGVLSTTTIFLVPKVKQQTEIFITRFTDYVFRMDEELYVFGSRYPIIKELVPQLKMDLPQWQCFSSLQVSERNRQV
jgi:predicted PurR-regulated permease PerM